MSRIGKKPVPVPSGVTVTLENQTVKVKGPKGELQVQLVDLVTVKHENDEINVSPIDQFLTLDTAQVILRPDARHLSDHDLVRFALLDTFRQVDGPPLLDLAEQGVRRLLELQAEALHG